jgi:hypothetical protein
MSENEWENLRSEISTANRSMVRTIPKAFKERGLYMLATYETSLELNFAVFKPRGYTTKSANAGLFPQKHKTISVISSSLPSPCAFCG